MKQKDTDEITTMRRKFKILDPITKEKQIYQVCAQHTQHELTSLSALGLDDKKMFGRAIVTEARQASSVKFFESIEKNAKLVTVELKNNDFIWIDFFKPILDMTNICDELVIKCGPLVTSIINFRILSNYVKSDIETNYGKYKFKLKMGENIEKDVLLICDQHMSFSDMNILLYDRKHKNVAININYEYNDDTEMMLSLAFEKRWQLFPKQILVY